MKIYNEGGNLIIENFGTFPLGKLFFVERGDVIVFSSVTDSEESKEEYKVHYTNIEDSEGNSFANKTLALSYLRGQVAASSGSPLTSSDFNFGAFGEQITAHKTPIVQIENKYNIDPANLIPIEIFEATGGSADNNKNMFRCQTGTSIGGYGVVRSRETLNYRAGQGVECQITAMFTTGVPLSLQFAGMFSLTETIAFGYDGANFSVLHSYGGAAEVQMIQVTATAVGNATVTLDSDSVIIPVTNSDVETNAEEIRAGIAGDPTLDAKWRVEQVGDKCFAIARSTGNKTGTMSITGDLTATITERTAGVDKTDNHVAQNDWDNPLPFTGFDPTKLNLYKIQFGYLGTANIVYSVYDATTGKFIEAHQIKWANANTFPNMGSPNMKTGWTSASLGASGTNLTVQGASSSLMLEGDEVIKNNTFADESIVSSVDTNLSSLITIKNRTVYADRFNLGKIIPLLVSVDNDHTKGAIIEVVRNATIGGTQNYRYEDEFNSIAIADTSGTTVSGGTLIDAFTVGAGLSNDLDLTILVSELLPDETLTIAGKTVQGTGATMTATIAWKEEK